MNHDDIIAKAEITVEISKHILPNGKEEDIENLACALMFCEEDKLKALLELVANLD